MLQAKIWNAKINIFPENIAHKTFNYFVSYIEGNWVLYLATHFRREFKCWKNKGWYSHAPGTGGTAVAGRTLPPTSWWCCFWGLSRPLPLSQRSVRLSFEGLLIFSAREYAQCGRLLYLRPLPRNEVCPAASVPLLRLTDWVCDLSSGTLRLRQARHVVPRLPRLDRRVTFDLKLGRRAAHFRFSRRAPAHPRRLHRSGPPGVRRLPCYASKFIPNWQRARVHTGLICRAWITLICKKTPVECSTSARAGFARDFPCRRVRNAVSTWECPDYIFCS